MKVKSWMRKLMVLVLSLALMCGLFPGTQKVLASTVKLNRKSVTLLTGDTVQLKLLNNHKKVKWTSGKSSVATVNSRGKVTAKRPGNATITAKAGRIRCSCKVRVVSRETQKIKENGVYTSKADVARYIHTYQKLPSNFITKEQAKALGWPGGSLEPYAPGKCIGGDRYSNFEKTLPTAEGRIYYECDINTLGAASRGAERLVYSNDGLIYYTGDHYTTFEKLY